jgi:hypothetical protein
MTDTIPKTISLKYKLTCKVDTRLDKDYGIVPSKIPLHVPAPVSFSKPKIVFCYVSI